MSRGHHKWKLLIVIGEVVVTTLEGHIIPQIRSDKMSLFVDAIYLCFLPVLEVTAMLIPDS